MGKRGTQVRKLKIGRRVPAALISLGLAAALGLSGCTSSPANTTATTAPIPAGGAGAPATTGPAALTVQPAGGAQNVAPGDPVKVSVTSGEIQNVALTNADGKPVAGQL